MLASLAFEFDANTQEPAAHTKLRNSTIAHSAAIVSRTKMKQSDIKTLSTFAAIPGLAQHYQASIELSTSLRIDQARQTCAATAATNFLGPDLTQLIQRLAASQSQEWRPTMTGNTESAISKRSTNSESATRQRSSSELITSDNISSTVMREQAGNGQTCWRMPACWKLTPPRDESIANKRGNSDTKHLKRTRCDFSTMAREHTSMWRIPAAVWRENGIAKLTASRAVLCREMSMFQRAQRQPRYGAGANFPLAWWLNLAGSSALAGGQWRGCEATAALVNCFSSLSDQNIMMGGAYED